MKPRRARLSGGGMVASAGPPAGLLHGDRTSTRTRCRRTWATGTWSPTTAERTTRSPRATGSSAGLAGRTGPPSPPLRGSGSTGTRARGPASGSAATGPWAGSGTGPCPTGAVGAGAEAAGAPPEVPPVVTGPERATGPRRTPPRGSVSFTELCDHS